jgi:hypothetical protein
MKRTDDKGTQSSQDKPVKPTPKTDNPRPNEKSGKIQEPKSPNIGDPQRNTPDKWQGDKPTTRPDQTHPDQRRDDDPDYDEIDEEEEEIESSR